jgi:tRNA-splicing ligase RtcB (3'-phosphate/5'-hydroxy nucleic acid ligase)
MIQYSGKYTTAKVMIDNVEPECVKQIVGFINHPAFTNPVAIMPDCHAGKGAVIGFTMKMSDKVIPNVIGVDIGCGMLSTVIGRWSLDLADIDKKIREVIPFGKTVNEKNIFDMKYFPWPVGTDGPWFISKCKQIGIDPSYAITSIGSLGGGNHFIELGKSEKTGDIVVTVHSGSRNFGKKVCDYWQKVAAGTDDQTVKIKILLGIEEIKKTAEDGQEIGRRVFELKKSLTAEKKVTGLEYLEGEDAKNYIFDMQFAQQYARHNRSIIMERIIDSLGYPGMDRKIKDYGPSWTVDTIHNFIDPQDHIIRKGAIRSYIGEQMIIPFNMRDGILLCEGKSNPDWNFSAPHGAGRVLSRSMAKKTLNLDQFQKQMDGVFSTSVCRSTLDEAPGAYKDSKIIEAAIEPTATIIDRIKPILNLKDREGDRDE